MKYMPDNSGSTIGAKTGSKIEYKKGVPTDDLPEGELDHCGFKPVEASNDEEADSPQETEKPTESNTVDEIKAYLDAEGIEYDSKAKKAELLELVG